MPRPIERGDAGGDRVVGSTLTVRRAGSFRFSYWVGSDGNGGTSTKLELRDPVGPELVDGRWGDGSRKVRPVIEVELFVRRRVPLTLAERRVVSGLTCDWVEDLR